MKAGIFTRQGVIDCYEVDMPEKKQSEVLIRTLRASICGRISVQKLNLIGIEKNNALSNHCCNSTSLIGKENKINNPINIGFIHCL